ncbi:hypothetical protein POX_f08352 [Penicillium oxalicum]|uniref:hypothetical protein n=1 Tax=Penicillium oxalicum TaxID=69781 RepID=UPI0020B76DDD|nr:hypothetical protein POX_f08352 [Penicillium oxalicum]KAI2787970.1 hypothetical protein POX_f08352 [Penicillium oxalicum]
MYWPFALTGINDSRIIDEGSIQFADGVSKIQECHGYLNSEDKQPIDVSASGTFTDSFPEPTLISESFSTSDAQAGDGKRDLVEDIDSSVWPTIREGTNPASSPIDSAIWPSPVSTWQPQKRLLRLSIEIIDDLKLLQNQENTEAASEDRCRSLNNRLDDFVARMLTYSANLISILNPEISIPSFQPHPIFPTDLVAFSNPAQLGMSNQYISNEQLTGSLATTIPPRGSDHATPRSSSSTIGSDNKSPERLSVFLCVLTAYKNLMRLYHAVYSQLHQYYLGAHLAGNTSQPTIPQAFSYTQAAGFESNKSTQTQTLQLIQTSHNLLDKLNSGLRSQFYCLGESEPETSQHPPPLDYYILLGIRGYFASNQEGNSENGLREKMNALSSFVLGSLSF